MTPGAAANDDGTVAISVGIDAIETLEIELTSLGGQYVDHRELVDVILQDIVLSLLNDVVGDGFLQKIPLPAVLLPKSLTRADGYTVISGALGDGITPTATDRPRPRD